MNKLPKQLREKEKIKFNDGEEKSSADRPRPTNKKATNNIVMSYARDEWIQRKLKDRESEYLEFRNLQLFCGTFNANGKSPTSIDISKWLQAGEEDPSKMKDCYVCGFQEIVDLSAANVIAEGHSSKRTTQWSNIIHQTLNHMASMENGEGGVGIGSGGSNNRNARAVSSSSGDFGGSFDSSDSSRQYSSNYNGDNNGVTKTSNHNDDNQIDQNNDNGAYRLIATKYLVGIAIVAFMKAEHVSNVRDVQVQTAGVGIGGFVGNKGAAALHFIYGNSSICIVSSHLSAHRGAVGSRNSDYNNILNKISFKDHIKTSSEEHGKGSGVSILDHDYVFWLGDLNYRIQVDISTEECYRRIKSNKINDLTWLRSQDQLNIERSSGRVFEVFDEEQLLFKPTYKYIPGTDLYDDRPDKKMRAPAWCDRILWYCRSGNNSKNNNDIQLIQQMNYQREDTIQISDHKPVYGTFEVQVKMIVKTEQKRVYDELMRGKNSFFEILINLFFSDFLKLTYLYSSST